jgi:hypothetical protein
MKICSGQVANCKCCACCPVAAAAAAGWEKPWVEQIIDRIMKGSLKTTEERTQGVVSELVQTPEGRGSQTEGGENGRG